MEAPITIEHLDARALERCAGPAVLDAVADVKGIDFRNGGLNYQRISARGFPKSFQVRMLTMVNGRLADLPGAGIPQNYMLPTSSQNVKSIEVVLGPPLPPTAPMHRQGLSTSSPEIPGTRPDSA